MKKPFTSSRPFFPLFLFVFICLAPMKSLYAQDYVTGSFEGEVRDSVTGNPIPGVTVRITNQETGVPVAKQTDSSGRFRQGLLPPGDYTITIVKQGYITVSLQRSLPALRPTQVLPPVPLVPEPTVAATPAQTPEPGVTPTPAPGVTPVPAQTTTNQQATIPATTAAAAGDIRGEINTIDGQRGGTFNQKEVSALPLGSITRVRSFDELALLLPGVAPPPMTQGEVAGPGVGAGVGSAGQFSVNGLRSRANNFTVDGSDNNDEDIGVRRQGFLALAAQPTESIREYQVITLLAPAQYGRNIGAQVNAVSRSGGNEHHGTIFGFLNSSQLNARNFFDATGGNTRTPLQGLALDLNNTLTSRLVDVRVDNQQKFVTNNAGTEDSFTLGQFGFVLGGPLNFGEGPPPRTPKLFYFVSAEGQILNAMKESNFAVPTVEQRGLNNSGASGLVIDNNPQRRAYPTSNQGDAIFSLFPFPNNPNGLYGRNTFTQVLPASGDGKIFSGKINSSFRALNREHQLTSRYNFTDDQRTIPVTGGGLFSSLRPRVQTQNFSTFLNGELTGPDAKSPIFNQLRLSYGRTRLAFDEVRDTEFLIRSGLFPNTPFLLNAPFLSNYTLPGSPFADFRTTGRNIETGLDGVGNILEGGLGPLGQVVIGGFSPVGVDVFNFPQKRVNNTYQFADTATLRFGTHSIAFGADIRRTELNSDLPRNSRPLITFNGGPQIGVDANGSVRFTNFAAPVFLAASAAASGSFQSQTRGGLGSNIGLRYHQFNFFGQDEWRVRPNLSLSYGLRYEYNTPPREVNRIIERSFNSPQLDLVPGLRNYIAGRTQIFDPDRNNFAPRVGFAYSPRLFDDKLTVIRAGYGIFYDQILGAVVSQSRNVFENFLTLNFGGGVNAVPGNLNAFPAFSVFNPALSVPGGFRNGVCFSRSANGVCLDFRPFVVEGTLNQSNNNFPLADLIRIINNQFPGGFGFTLPARHLESPTAQQYSATVDQQLSSSMVLSVGYVGTQGRHLLRVTTPNLGPNTFIVPIGFDVPRFQNGVPASSIPFVVGATFGPGQRITPAGNIIGGRPVPSAGSVTIYETSANSRYDALQAQLRGRYNLLGATQFQVSYTYGKVNDDVSDVFDLAGASALPQNSLTFAGERGPANFDVRHRVSSNYISDFSSWGKNNSFLHAIFNGLEVAGTGIFQTGQPFTVNSVNDINLDGNLTDRLNSTTGIVLTDDRAQPLRLTVPASTLLAPVGQDGRVPRNSFRAGNLWLTNAAVIKTISFSEHKKLLFRTEVFNLFNRANFGVPVRFLESPGFGRATETVTPGRRIQFGLKFAF